MKNRNQKPETRNCRNQNTTKRRTLLLLVSGFCFLLSAACRSTVGVSRTPGGFAEVAPTVAEEMIIDSNQIVVIDIRPAEEFNGPKGHIAGALNAPMDTIERQLPELLPYTNETVLVYGDTSTDGALAARLLTVAGFRNVVHIGGGLQGWIERGYRTVNAH